MPGSQLRRVRSLVAELDRSTYDSFSQEVLEDTFNALTDDQVSEAVVIAYGAGRELLEREHLPRLLERFQQEKTPMKSLKRIRKEALVVQWGMRWLAADERATAGALQPFRTVTRALGGIKDTNSRAERQRLAADAYAQMPCVTMPSCEAASVSTVADRIYDSLGNVAIWGIAIDEESLHHQRRRFRAGLYAMSLLYLAGPRSSGSFRNLRAIHQASKDFGQIYAMHAQRLRQSDIPEAYIEVADDSFARNITEVASHFRRT